MKIKIKYYQCFGGNGKIKEVEFVNFHEFYKYKKAFWSNAKIDIDSISVLNPDKKDIILEEYKKYLEEENL